MYQRYFARVRYEKSSPSSSISKLVSFANIGLVNKVERNLRLEQCILESCDVVARRSGMRLIAKIVKEN